MNLAELMARADSACRSVITTKRTVQRGGELLAEFDVRFTTNDGATRWFFNCASTVEAYRRLVETL